MTTKKILVLLVLVRVLLFRAAAVRWVPPAHRQLQTASSWSIILLLLNKVKMAVLSGATTLLLSGAATTGGGDHEILHSTI